MTSLNEGPFGTYPTPTGTIDATAKTELTGLIDELRTLIARSQSSPPPVHQMPMPHPDFDAMRVELGDKLHAELDAIDAAIQAA